MKYTTQILIALAIALTVTILYIDATTDVEESDEAKAFNSWAISVIDEAKADSTYKRIPLDSRADQRWFMETMFKAWEKKITKEDFIKIGAEKFPNNKESFEFVANRLP